MTPSRAETTERRTARGRPGGEGGTGTRFPPAATWALAAGWVVAATVLQLARQTGVPSVDTIWAEDGQLFLTDALRDPLGSILAPAGGYLHLLPRLLAALAAALPLDSSALVFAVGSAGVVSLLSLYVFVAARSLIPSPWARATLAATVALLPAALLESVANAANLQYYLLFAAFWAMLHRPAALGGRLAGMAVVAGAAMSTTQSALLVPLAVWTLVRARRGDRFIAVAFLAALAVQALTVVRAVFLEADPTLGGQYPVRWTASNAAELPGLFALRVVAALLLGDRWVDEVWLAVGWWAAGIAVLVLGAALAVGFGRAGRNLRWWVGVAVVYSVAAFAMPVLARGTEHLAPLPTGYSYAGNRYVLVPMWFLVSALLLGLGDRDRARPRIPSLVMAVILAVLIVVNYSLANPRSVGPSWSRQLAAAGDRCQVSSPRLVRIPITPRFRGVPAWRVTTTCRRLE